MITPQKTTPKMNLIKKILLPGILVLAILLLPACSLSAPGGNQAPADKTPAATLLSKDGSNVLAEGRLMPNQSIGLAFLSGGRIKEILVSEGSVVEAGQGIARLDGADQLQTALDAAQFELLSARQAIATLNENYAGALAQAKLQLAQAKIDLKDAQDKRTSMIYRRASDSTLNGLQADLILAQEELDKATDHYDHVKGGDSVVVAEALRRLSSAQSARDRAQYNVNYAADLPEQDEIDKADANILIASAKVETARIQLERLSSGPDSNDLALANARLQKAGTDLKARQSDLANLELKAPFGGKIVDLNITVGEQVNPGQTIATLADFSRWIVKTSNLTEIKVVQLRIGQTVTMVPDALPDVSLTGTVERISDGFLEKQGDITYTVDIALNQTDERLRWGMTFGVRFAPTASEGSAVQPSAQATLAPTTRPVSAPTPTVDSGSAENTAKSYFEALEKQDPQTAASFLSNYSLVAEKTTRDAAAEVLQTQFLQGNRWSAFEMKESRTQNPDTVLVHVAYQVETKDPKTGAASRSQVDEWWPVRQENGQWLYNWKNVIDFRAYDLAAQTTAGLTVAPLQISRYSDRMSLRLFVQNRTNETIVLGQPNEYMAIFHFGEKQVEAAKTKLIFASNVTYPDVTIDAAGSFSDYPDKVEIRKWKDFQVAPWYSFQFGK